MELHVWLGDVHLLSATLMTSQELLCNFYAHHPLKAGTDIAHYSMPD